MKTGMLTVLMCCLLVGMALACRGNEEPESDVVTVRTAVLPPVVAVDVPERADVNELELSGTPVTPVQLERSDGLGLPAPRHMSPTVAAVAGSGEGVYGNDGKAGSDAGLVNPVRRFTCTIAYRSWLVDYEWQDARDLHNGLADFRQQRPDCDGEKFAPVFSNLAVCQHEKRVGGVVVAKEFSGGPTASSLGLSVTKKSVLGMLIHFERLPTLESPGCWYYQATEDYWVQGVVDDSGRAVSLFTPTPEAEADNRFLGCDSELRERLATMSGAAGAGDIQALVDRVIVGYGNCNLGWGAVVSPDPLWTGCPEAETGRVDDGSAVVHWSAPPADGSGCWIYDPEEGSWESVPVEP